MKRKYISNMPIEGFSKYHICKNGRLYSIHSGTWRLIKPVAKSTGYISNNLISDSGKRANFYRHRLVAEVYLKNLLFHTNVTGKHHEKTADRTGRGRLSVHANHSGKSRPAAGY